MASKLLRTFSELYERVGDGVVMPSAVETEESVLGAMLVDKTAAAKAIGVLGEDGIQPDDEHSPFYVDAHKHVYAAIVGLQRDSDYVDLLTVTNRLRTTGTLDAAGGVVALMVLTQKLVTTAHVETHALIVLEKFIARRYLLQVEESRLRAMANEDIYEIMEAQERGMMDLGKSAVRRSLEQIGKGEKEVWEFLEFAGKQPGGVTGIASGIEDLDRKTGGWQKSDLIIIAGRTSMGKTQLALECVRTAALENNVPVGFFSLEMSSLQLKLRLYCSQAGVPIFRARTGQLSDEEWRRVAKAMQQYHDSPLYIDDTPKISVSELRSKAMRMQDRKGLEMVVVDYLSLMSPSAGFGERPRYENRAREVGDISRSLKALGKEMNVPVIALQQLNREVEHRQSKEPQLSDLKESGSIEEDADVVCLLYRPAYYGIEQGPPPQSKDLRFITEINVAKDRGAGQTGKVEAAFDVTSGRFFHEARRFGMQMSMDEAAREAQFTQAEMEEEDTF